MDTPNIIYNQICIPNEMLSKIFSPLKLKEMAIVAVVCKQWQQATNDILAWGELTDIPGKTLQDKIGKAKAIKDRIDFVIKNSDFSIRSSFSEFTKIFTESLTTELTGDSKLHHKSELIRNYINAYRIRNIANHGLGVQFYFILKKNDIDRANTLLTLGLDPNQPAINYPNCLFALLNVSPLYSGDKMAVIELAKKLIDFGVDTSGKILSRSLTIYDVMEFSKFPSEMIEDLKEYAKGK